MSPWMFAIPLVSALIGWCFHTACTRYFLNRYLPKQRAGLAKALSTKIESLLPFSQLENKISSPELIEKAMPMIETHIDEFLSVKLPEEIPMLAMFVGNKTTDKIKDVFINQLRALFQKVMNKLLGDLKSTFPVQATIEAEIEKMDLAALVKENIPGGPGRIGWMGLLLGLIIGLINLLMISIFQ